MGLSFDSKEKIICLSMMLTFFISNSFSVLIPISKGNL